MKTCNKCGISKSLDAFRFLKHNKNGTVLGHMKDNIDILKTAITYLESKK